MMKNVVIIPAVKTWNDIDPLTHVTEGVTLLDLVYSQAKATSLVDMVLVTSCDREVGRYCNTKIPKLPFFPSSETCVSGTHRCADVAKRFKPDSNVANVICWPISEPTLRPNDIDNMIAKHQPENVSTLARNVPVEEQERFLADSNLVKVRIINQAIVDFSRCPLPRSLQHIGIYMFSLSRLLYLGAIEPTRLSKEEKLEQLTWLQYSHDQNPHLIRVAINTLSNSWKSHLSIHTQSDIELLREAYKCEQSK